jgi:hypothetical protein
MLTPAEMDPPPALPESDDDGPTQIVGWYCSKTQKHLGLTEHDHRIFDSLCPEPWQTLLLIHPSKGDPTKAAFGFREARTFTSGEWLDLAWQDLSGVEKPTEPAPKAAAAAPVAPAPPPPAIQEPEQPDVIPVAMPRGGTLFGKPGQTEPPKKKTQRPWKTNLLFAGIVLVVLALIALLLRGIFGS